MSITAKDVNELRKKTGAGMMDCKNALVESNDQLYGLLSEGDFDYYDKVQARYQNPIFVTYHIKPYLNYQFKEKWGLELNMF